MKTIKSLQIVALSIIGLGLPVTGHCQTYYFSTPISGSLTMTVQDVYSGQYGSFQLNLNSLTENIYIDPINDTIREVGAFSYTPSASNITLTKTSLSQITSTLTVDLAPVGGVLPFDTGNRYFTGGSGGQYSYGGVMPSLGDFNASYSLVTGGQTYSGSFGYSMDAFFVPNYAAYHGLLATAYPNSITLNNLASTSGYFTPSTWNSDLPITAANGVQWDLKLGSSYWNSELFTANLPSSITAVEVVPEPASLSLMIFGMFGITLLRRHQR